MNNSTETRHISDAFEFSTADSILFLVLFIVVPLAILLIFTLLFKKQIRGIMSTLFGRKGTERRSGFVRKLPYIAILVIITAMFVFSYRFVDDIAEKRRKENYSECIKNLSKEESNYANDQCSRFRQKDWQFWN